MSLPGDTEAQLYTLARRALLDALDALEPHLGAVVLVGAQAIYLRTGAADLAVAEFTTDADLALVPELIADEPGLAELMQSSGFTPGDQPGRWISRGGVPCDLMVPEALAGPGRRGADLGSHGRHVARRARGLEGALVEREQMVVASLDSADNRETTVLVAGGAALLVAKLIKISERVEIEDRSRDKDALDILRLLPAVPPPTLQVGVAKLLRDDFSRDTTLEAIGHLEVLFGSIEALGAKMAARAAHPLENADTITASCATLARSSLQRWQTARRTAEDVGEA